MKNLNFKIICIMLAFMPNLLSAGGLDKAQKLMDKISIGLHGLALTTVTIAVMWIGYGILFGGKRIQDFGNVIIGAIIIASSAEIAALLM